MLTLKRAAGRAVATAAGIAGTAHASLQKDAFWNLPSGVTSLSREEYGLHMMAFWVVVVIGVLVFGTMFYSLFAHRRSRHPTPSNFHENTTVEVIWTIIPFLILVGMAIPAAATLIHAYDTRNADLTIKVTGVQWKWEYAYPEQGLQFVSGLDAASTRAAPLDSGVDPSSVPDYLRGVDHPMVVPVGEKIRLLITSADVDHGWWVEDLGVKKNAYPGFINEAWFKADRIGTYRGQCTVLCGYGHGYMPIVVKVVSQQDFKGWAAQMKHDGFGYTPSASELAAVTSDSDAGARTRAPVAPASTPAPATSAAGD
ncbi:MAG: cytochrome c oxidase subunit II [Gammaproteobacteria bacterium]|nr:cytochrome c oxidase subunit II [Gammaproteobacteria bacterium]